MTEGRHPVVVVGGGFGGVRVTRALARADADVTIVDRAHSGPDADLGGRRALTWAS